ncbi:MAG TPA: DUF523 and DUF1722 domain-containing protein [Kofleriaceae bacterium]|nr:DUF523 and DUF1722 domain-containing protein [Kofleriaceae bacterium]
MEVEHAQASRPRVGVSACLVGREVRYDGGHKRSAFLVDVLAPFVELVPVCPEVESGMPVPREAIRLVGDGARARLIGVRTHTDHTDAMERWTAARLDELACLDLDGYVLKKDSPSCGLERVRLYASDEPGASATRAGAGLFAAALGARLPTLPLCEEGWLSDAALREAFLDRLFTHHRLRLQMLAGPTRAALIAFHASHKFLYMAHSPVGYRRLGRLVAQVAEGSIADAVQAYTAEAMAALAVRATPGKHANVLQHILGYFKDELSAPDKREVLDLIGELRAGVNGLAVPLALLAHHLRRSGQDGWLAQQVYFEPYPRAIGRRPAGA